MRPHPDTRKKGRPKAPTKGKTLKLLASQQLEDGIRLGVGLG